MTSKTTTNALETGKAALSARLNGAKDVATTVSGALGAGAKAYAAGILDLGRSLGGFGREILNETGAHVRATVQAKNLRAVAELQAAYLQHRVEMSATYSKEFVDLARARSEAVIAPVVTLLNQDKAA